MRVAIVQELLTIRGGAERVARVLADLFPEAPVFTLLYDQRRLGDWFPPTRVRTSRLQPFARLTTNHHCYLPFFPGAVEAWDFSDYDLVLSSSSAFTHGIRTTGATRHISFVHAPARYLWDRAHDVLARERTKTLGGLRAAALSHLAHRLRMWDVEASPRPHSLLAASRSVQRRIELYWHRDSTVLYPPINDQWFATDLPSRNDDSPLLIVSTLAPYKRLDLAIEACNRLSRPLLIAGDGPDRSRLEQLAGPTVSFLGYCDQAALQDVYDQASALLFPGEEDFGLVGPEALACGLPALAYHGGGALEWLTDGETGAFFAEPTADSLTAALESFIPSDYDPAACRTSAQRFRRDAFESQLRREIEEALAA